MNDDNTVNSSSLDQGVDSKLSQPVIKQERYDKAENNVIAKTHSPVSDTTPSPKKSWTMGEIDRVVAAEVLPATNQRLGQFAVGLARRSDFRLKDFTRRIEYQTRRDFHKEINVGPLNRRLRDYDIKSYTMRMVTANASLGTYQFHKAQSLPFMRKSLALGYEKVNLLKKIASGITGLERSVVTKLEAIKMNTAASAPIKETMIDKIRKAIKDKTVDRIATNFSNVTLAGYDEKYKKYVSPVLSRIHAKMSQEGRGGGVNGTIGLATNKLNALRHSVAKAALDSNGAKTPFNKMASTILSGALKVTQRARLPAGLSSFIAKPLTSFTSFADKVKPFESSGTTRPTESTTAQQDSPLALPGQENSSLLRFFKREKKELDGYRKTLLTNVVAIRHQIAPDQKGLPGRKALRRRETLIKTKLLTPSSPYGPHLPTGSNSKAKHEDIRHPRPSILTALFGKLSDKIGKLDKSLVADRKTKSIFDKLQAKRQALMDKLANRAKLRKGSYEDLEAQRKKGRGFIPWGKMGALGALGGAAAAVPSDPDNQPIDKTGIPSISEAALLGLAFAGRKLLGYGSQGAKYLAGKGLSIGKKAVPAAARGGAKTAGVLGRFALKEAKGLSKVSGRGVGAVGLGSAKMLGRGGLGLLRKVPLLGLLLESSDYLSGQRNVNWRNLAKSGLSLGGGALGGLLGGLVTAGFGGQFLGGAGGYAAGSALGNSLFGDDKKTNAASALGLTNRRDNQLSLMERFRHGLSTGDGKEGFLGRLRHGLTRDGITHGFEKTFYGDKYSNGEYKQGTDLISEARVGLKTILKNFGNALYNLPKNTKDYVADKFSVAGQRVRGLKNGIVSGSSAAAKATGGYARDRLSVAGQRLGNLGSGIGAGASSAYNKLTYQNLTSAASAVISFSPTNFAIGASSAILGWGSSSGLADDPTTPFHGYVSLILDAYGIKNRSLYSYIHSLELSQEKINTNQSKPFDDSDMLYMASRFGLDGKSKDAVNYFKLWYKRRFLPALILITKVLKAYKLSLSSAMAADDKVMMLVNTALKKEISSSDLKNLGLEPSVQAYNKYAKIGSNPPGQVSGSTLTNSKPYDPRNPKNIPNGQGGSGGIFGRIGAALGFGGNTSPNGFANDNYSQPQPASRNQAKIVKGGVKDQPQFKDAYQKLPPDIKKVVNQSKTLQFVLWSTSIQHGADGAALIFQRDYSDKLDEKGYIRSIYQDRSTKFSNLGSMDRTSAVQHLGEEQRFVEGMRTGSNNPDMATMGREVSNVISPNGNSNLGYDPSSVKSVAITGNTASRAKDAMQYLMGKKYNKNAAAGIVGNLLEESSLMTNRPGDSGRAYGLAQWHPDRRNAIARQFGKPVEAMNFHEQLDAVDWEIRSGHGVSGGGSLFGDLNNAKDAGEAARLIMNRYERPAERQANGVKRTRNAMSVLKTMGDGASVAKPASMPAAPPASKPASVAKPATKQAPQKAGTTNDLHPLTKPMTAHGNSLAEHAAALREHTAALMRPPSTALAPAAGNKSHHVSVNPLFLNPASTHEHFVTMSMKKAAIAAG